VNWGAIWATLSAIVVGAATNELCDVAPWLAKRVLKRAARLEATHGEEEALILNELLALLEDVPGKLSKLIWSLARLGYSTRFVAAGVKRSIERFRGRVTHASRMASAVNLILSVFMIAGASIATFTDIGWWTLPAVAVTVFCGGISNLQFSRIVKNRRGDCAADPSKLT
jgi:hypothetical protein